MSDFTMFPKDEARPKMDDLLRDYFQAERPHPWPAFQAPRGRRTSRPLTFWSRYSGRVALAACIALLMAGYRTLGGFFPHPNTPTVVESIHHIGLKEKGSKAVLPGNEPLPAPSPTPNGQSRFDHGRSSFSVRKALPER